MRICLAVGMIALCVSYSSATTIVIVRTPEHIVVGADRLLVRWQATRGAANSFSCKLHKHKSTLFTITGMGVLDPGTGFSAEQLAREAVQHSASLQEASAYFARTAVKPYEAVMRSMRKESPRDWDLIVRYRGKGIPLIAAFFGIERGVLKYILVGLRTSIGRHIVVVADTVSCPGVACEGEERGRHAIVLGQSEAAYRQLGRVGTVSFANFQANHSDLELAQSIVAIEERSAPTLVGGSIDIVTVDAAGDRWNTSAGSCLNAN